MLTNDQYHHRSAPALSSPHHRPRAIPHKTRQPPQHCPRRAGRPPRSPTRHTTRDSAKPGTGGASRRPPRGLPHASSGAEPDQAPTDCVEGLPPSRRVVGLRQADEIPHQPQRRVPEASGGICHHTSPSADQPQHRSMAAFRRLPVRSRSRSWPAVRPAASHLVGHRRRHERQQTK